MKKKIILDCDPGMDDSIAIILAAKSPSIELLGITTCAGNFPVEITAGNALKVVELLNKDIPVAMGLEKPLCRELPFDPFSHGNDGQANNNLKEASISAIDKGAVDFIREKIYENKGDITIVCTGPLTNLAKVFQLYPETVDMINEVVSLSGAFGVTEYAYRKATGDTPQSEWNVYVDPEAADIVYNSGVKFTAIGLDIATHFEVDFNDNQIDSLRSSNNKEANFLYNAIKFVRGRGYGAYTTVIDALAVAYVINPDMYKLIEAKVGIETEGKYSLGNTVWDRRDHHAWEDMTTINIGASVEYDRFIDLLLKYILGV